MLVYRPDRKKHMCMHQARDNPTPQLTPQCPFLLNRVELKRNSTRPIDLHLHNPDDLRNLSLHYTDTIFHESILVFKRPPVWMSVTLVKLLTKTTMFVKAGEKKNRNRNQERERALESLQFDLLQKAFRRQ